MTDKQRQALGLNITTKLFKKKMTQKELASKVGCSPEYISMVIYGAKTPSLAKFLRIAAALGCTTDELLKESK